MTNLLKPAVAAFTLAVSASMAVAECGADSMNFEGINENGRPLDGYLAEIYDFSGVTLAEGATMPVALMSQNICDLEGNVAGAPAVTPHDRSELWALKKDASNFGYSEATTAQLTQAYNALNALDCPQDEMEFIIGTFDNDAEFVRATGMCPNFSDMNSGSEELLGASFTN